MKLKKYNEELEFNLPTEYLKKIESEFISNLDQYKLHIIDNIKSKDGKIFYRDFDNIDIDMILNQLNLKFGSEIVIYFNVETFLRKIYQLLDLKYKRTKEGIELEFSDYYVSLEERVNEYISGENGQIGKEEEHFDRWEGEKSILNRKQYEDEKYKIQIELVKLQEWVRKNNKKIVMVFEGRDSAGKGSTIKRFIEAINPRIYRVVALGMPNKWEKVNWFKRYERHLPAPGEIVFFDRSWYNRAVVEPALGYCDEYQYKNFMERVNEWEDNIINSDTILIKFWFSITKEKQLQRFELRKTSPIKFWKFSPNDEKVVDKWDIITKYKNQMFERTSTEKSPWVIINSNDKKIGRLNAMRYALSVINYDDKDESTCEYYTEVVNVIK
jgi:polyphosphate kinase 2